MDNSIEQRRNHEHFFEAVLRRRRILVWSHCHSQLHAAHVAAIIQLDLAEFTGRQRLGWEASEAAQHPDASFPQDPSKEQAETDPNDRVEGGHDFTLPAHRCRVRSGGRTGVETLEDHRIRHTTALAHHL